MTGRLAAVTGGTGFLGRHCAAALAARGWQVRMLVRRDPTHPLLADIPIELVLGDLQDRQALSRLVAGASVVVHAAGATRALDAASYHATNAEGTARLADAVARHAPRCRFVQISSQAARHPELSAYAASKREGEQAVIAGLAGGDWVILRPAILYGPWDPATQVLLRLAAAPLLPVPTDPEPRLAILHVHDAAQAIAAFCEPGPPGRIFELCGPGAHGHPWREIVQAARPCGMPRYLTVPDSVLLASGAAADAWSRATGRPSLFGLGKAREILQRDWRPDPALRPPHSLWSPAISLPDGMRQTRDWVALLGDGRQGSKVSADDAVGGG